MTAVPVTAVGAALPLHRTAADAGRAPAEAGRAPADREPNRNRFRPTTSGRRPAVEQSLEWNVDVAAASAARLPASALAGVTGGRDAGGASTPGASPSQFASARTPAASASSRHGEPFVACTGSAQRGREQRKTLLPDAAAPPHRAGRPLRIHLLGRRDQRLRQRRRIAVRCICHRSPNNPHLWSPKTPHLDN